MALAGFEARWSVLRPSSSLSAPITEEQLDTRWRCGESVNNNTHPTRLTGDRGGEARFGRRHPRDPRDPPRTPTKRSQISGPPRYIYCSPLYQYGFLILSDLVPAFRRNACHYLRSHTILPTCVIPLFVIGHKPTIFPCNPLVRMVPVIDLATRSRQRNSKRFSLRIHWSRTLLSAAHTTTTAHPRCQWRTSRPKFRALRAKKH